MAGALSLRLSVQGPVVLGYGIELWRAGLVRLGMVGISPGYATAKPPRIILSCWLWIGGYLLWMGRLWTMTMRYYLPLYGALAVVAGWCLYALYRHAKIHKRSLPITSLLLAGFGTVFGLVGLYQVANSAADATALTALAIAVMLLGSAFIPQVNRYRPLVLATFAIAFSIIWGLMHSNIYRHQTTLVQSARYIFERIPGDFAMKIEGTDDTVPLINIAIGDTGVSIPALRGSPFDRATQYEEDLPVRVSFTAPESGLVTSLLRLISPIPGMMRSRKRSRYAFTKWARIYHWRKPFFGPISRGTSIPWAHRTSFRFVCHFKWKRAPDTTLKSPS